MKKTFIIHYIGIKGWSLKDRVECEFDTLKNCVEGMKSFGDVITRVEIVTGKRYGMELTADISI